MGAVVPIIYTDKKRPTRIGLFKFYLGGNLMLVFLYVLLELIQRYLFFLDGHFGTKLNAIALLFLAIFLNDLGASQQHIQFLATSWMDL